MGEAYNAFEARRLAVFLPSLESGGAEGVVTTLVNEFVRRGVRVTLLLAHATGPHLVRLDSRVQCIELSGGSVKSALPILIAWLRRERPDTLYSAMTHANVIACLATILAGMPELRLVVSERMSLAARKELYSSAGERLLLRLMPLVYRRAQSIVVPASTMIGPLAKHIKAPREKFRLIGNPTVGADFRDRAACPWPLGEELVRSGARIVLAVGRLSQVKGFDDLISAFSMLPAEHNAHLVILGEGEERKFLLSLVSKLGLDNRVHMPGFDPNPVAAMSKAKVFVLSSLFEGLPNALIEALACGTRVIATDCPSGPAEILDGGRWGRLVPPGNQRALSRAIGDALTSPTWPNGLKKASEFEVHTVVDRYLNVLFPA